MKSMEHDSAVRRLEAARVEQERLRERHTATIGTSAELRSFFRLKAAGDQVAARETWLRWVDEEGLRGLNAGPFELLAEQTLAAPGEREQEASDDDSDGRSARGGRSRTKQPAHARATRERALGSGLRDQTGSRERDVSARRRDELALLRDRIATGHDQEATDLDARDDLSDRHTLRVEELRAHAHASRIRAGSDREQAARGREQAGRDRQQAAVDREQAAFDREESGTDELTGARRRGVGLEELGNEVKRSRREGNSLVAAYVDVDGLKAVNDEHGHAAGDELLKTVAGGLRRHMRPYDLLVRLGGDEFLCALPNVTPAEARQRFGGLRSELKDSVDGSVSVGFSELDDGDSPEAFVARADSDLLARRSG